MSGVRELCRTLAGDYRRHGSRLLNPAFWAVAVYHYGRWSLERRGLVRWLSSKIYGLLFHWIEFTTSMALNREFRCGEGLHIVHGGNIRIHPKTVIGRRCGIMHDVTLGTNMERDGAPVVGDDVFIGAGAKVLGPVTIGDGARISANSLVIQDVPPGATAVGVPARVLLFRKSVSAEPSGAPAPSP